MAAVIRAAGGVVTRPAAVGLQVCLVHRSRYDDWSLPKGKLHAGEHPLAAAVREIAEETAVRAAPQIRLTPVRYRVRDGSPKVVDYWSMRVVSAEEFHPNDEVERLEWLTIDEATRRVSYPHDARVLREFAALPPVTGVVLLVRHASAGKRGSWPGPDTARPLDAAGLSQAEALADLLALFGPTRLISAAPRRCLQTVAPLAKAVDLPVEVESVFDEPAPEQDADRHATDAAARLPELAAASPVTVVCSQRDVVAPALARLAGNGTTKAYATPKGTGWVLSFAGDHPAALDRLSPTDSTPPR